MINPSHRSGGVRAAQKREGSGPGPLEKPSRCAESIWLTVEAGSGGASLGTAWESCSFGGAGTPAQSMPAFLPFPWEDALVPTAGQPSPVYWSPAKAGEHPGLQAEGLARPAGCGSFAPRSAFLSLKALATAQKASCRWGRGEVGEGRRNLSMALTSKSGNLTASPRPSSVLRGAPDPASCVLDKVPFAMQLDGFSDGREN